MADTKQEKLKKLVLFKQDPSFASFKELVGITEGLIESNEKTQHTNEMIRTVAESLSVSEIISSEIPKEESVQTPNIVDTKLKKLVLFKQDPTFASFKELINITENLISSNSKTQHTNELVRTMVEGFSVDKLIGPQGLTGNDGSDGRIGTAGAQGIQGLTGLIGPTGVGLAGKDGKDGRSGPKGETGLVGPKGFDGSPDTGLQIIEKVNALPTDEDLYKIDFSHIKNVPKVENPQGTAPIHRGGQQISILDEGVKLTSRVESINITGGGGTATTSGNDVTINIPAVVGTQWTTSGTDIYYNTGNVGIGTTNPTALFHLSSVATTVCRFQTTDTSGGVIEQRFASGAGGGTSRIGFRFSASDNGLSIFDYQNSLERVRFTQAGNVGIGTNAPTAKLDIVNTTDSASNQVLILEGDRATPTTNDEIYQSFKLSNSIGTQIEFARIRVQANDITSGSEDARLDFYVAVAGTLTHKLRLEGANFYPVANDGAALGAGTASWSDLFLASGGVINFNNGNATLTHSAGLITSSVALSLGVANVFTAGTIELGHATDTTIARVSAGVVSVEGVPIITSAGVTSGTILKNNGTTFVASTETYAPPSTSGNVMTSDGTNWVSTAPAISWTTSAITISQSAVANNTYITNSASLITLTLPVTATVGDSFKIIGKGSGGWRVAQNASQQIIWNEGGVDGTDETTIGVGGRLDSTDDNDFIELICITADNLWGVMSSKGNINLV